MGAVSGIGAKLLKKMGWSEGTGLGAKRDGNVEPICVKSRSEKLGVGAERRPFQNAWWEGMMEDAYGPPAEKKDESDLLDACGGRRCRPHGSAKLARLEAHDQNHGGSKPRDGASAADADARKVLRKKKVKRSRAKDKDATKGSLKMGIEKKRKRKKGKAKHVKSNG